MSLPAAKQERFHFLDVLRGISASVIMFHHATTSNIVKLIAYCKIPFLGFYFEHFTHSAVELLYVLSGVVLLRPFMRKQKPFKVGQYYKRRILRIYPPYLCALIFGALVNLYMQYYPTWYNIKVHHPYFSWTELLHESVIINFDGQYYNLAWWSLNLEMIFYLFVPFIVFLFPAREKLNNMKIAIMIIVTFILSISLQLFLTQYYPEVYSYKYLVANAYEFITYPVCFLMGVIIATVDFDIKAAFAFILPGIVLVLASWFYLPLVNAGYGLIYGGIIVLLFNRKSMQYALVNPIMIWIGERSYSIFLVHFSVFYIVDNLTALVTTERNWMYGIISRGVGIPVSLFVSMLLFHFVEKRQARGLLTGDIFWPWQLSKIRERLREAHNF